MATEKVLGRVSLGVFLLRYGNYFPYTSLFIQSLKTSHYISLERNIQDLKAFVQEIKDALSSNLGEDVTPLNLRRLFASENRAETARILFESINLDRLERVCSSLYVTIVTCMATGLSEQAAKIGLGLNVSSVISHTLFKLVRPAIPETQPLLRFFSRAACASIGIIAAFRLEKSLLVWANCLLGAELLVGSVELLLGARRCESIDSEETIAPISPSFTSRVRTSCVWALAGSSLLVQYAPGSEMPVWVKGVLIGPRMFEYCLQALSPFSFSISFESSIPRQVWSMLCRSLRRLVVLESEQIRSIIVNADKNAIGRISDDFDKSLKSFFIEEANRRTLALDLLHSTGDSGRLRVPEKIREEIIVSLLKNMDGSHLVSIPRVLRRLPQTMMASENEDKVFESFLQSFVKNIELLNKTEIHQVIQDVGRLHMKHPCKEEPLVRFISALHDLASPESCALTLSAVAETVSLQKLAHPVIRASLLSMVNCLEPTQRFHLLRSISQLPVFPEALAGFDVGSLPTAQDALVETCLGLMSIRGSEKLIAECVSRLSIDSIVAVIQQSVSLDRINPHVAGVLIETKNIEEVVLARMDSVPGYLRLLEVSPERLERVVVTVKPKLESIERMMDLGQCLHVAKALRSENFFNQQIKPRLDELRPRDIRILLSGEADGVVANLVTSSIHLIEKPETVAAVLSRTNSGTVATYLSKLLVKCHKDLETLFRVWNVVTDRGASFAHDKPETRRVLKELTRIIFKQTRMAPIV